MVSDLLSFLFLILFNVILEDLLLLHRCFSPFFIITLGSHNFLVQHIYTVGDRRQIHGACTRSSQVSLFSSLFVLWLFEVNLTKWNLTFTVMNVNPFIEHFPWKIEHKLRSVWLYSDGLYMLKLMGFFLPPSYSHHFPHVLIATVGARTRKLHHHTSDCCRRHVLTVEFNLLSKGWARVWTREELTHHVVGSRLGSLAEIRTSLSKWEVIHTKSLLV